MEEKMKKFDSMLSFYNAEPHITIEVTANVKLVKMGGGGVEYLNSGIRIFVTIILRGFLSSLLLIFLALLLLNFW
jgi:hypothetical protein